MTPLVYDLFNKITQGLDISGAVLEVGAINGPESLLNLPAFEKAEERVGVNLSGQEASGSNRYLKINANDLGCFKDGHFQVVVSNATLEHDPYFWKTLAEIKRVTASGGVIILGVPGYAGMGLGRVFAEQNLLHKFLRFIARISDKNVLSSSCITLGEHFYPGDYYRFSEQALREVFFEGLNDVCIHTVMNPPRFIGVGYKP